MKNLDQTAKQLFAKIRGRFPGVTIGDSDGNVTTNPEAARFFEFPFKEGDEDLGKISVSLEEENGVVIMYQKDVAENSLAKSKWYDFLKELRQFAKKRMLNFDTRDITKSNLEKRDYQYLAKRPEDSNMNESKMYGTSKLSYQNVDNARLVIKHTESINQEIPTGRTQKIGAIYVENADGERFKYPYKHLSGARAMARHVAEGGNPYDDFGKHITGLSEEMSKLRKFKTYMGRSAVMAESLSEYMDVVKDRVSTVKKTIESLQKPKFYAEAVEAFAPVVMEDVPADVAENWIDQLTIRQFNEELSDVFPYIYKLIGEATKATELGPEDLEEVAGPDKCWPGHRKVGTQPGTGKNKGKRVNKCKKIESEEELERGFEEMMGQFAEEKSKGSFEPHPGAFDWDANMDDDDDEEDTDEGAHAVRKAKMDGPDGDEITIEKEQTPLTEFILSYYDRESGEFPKGETAILTKIEKDYGEQFIEPAKAFIEQVNALYDQFQMQTQSQQMEVDTEYNRMRELAGLR